VIAKRGSAIDIVARPHDVTITQGDGRALVVRGEARVKMLTALALANRPLTKIDLSSAARRDFDNVTRIIHRLREALARVPLAIMHEKPAGYRLVGTSGCVFFARTAPAAAPSGGEAADLGLDDDDDATIAADNSGHLSDLRKSFGDATWPEAPLKQSRAHPARLARPLDYSATGSPAASCADL
jgi:hypothetical protein